MRDLPLRVRLERLAPVPFQSLLALLLESDPLDLRARIRVDLAQVGLWLPRDAVYARAARAIARRLSSQEPIEDPARWLDALLQTSIEESRSPVTATEDLEQTAWNDHLALVARTLGVADPVSQDALDIFHERPTVERQLFLRGLGALRARDRKALSDEEWVEFGESVRALVRATLP